MSILLCLAAAFLACSTDTDDSEVVTLERGDLVVTVELTGTLKAIDSQSLGPPTIPRIWQYKIAFMAPEGKLVEPGVPALGFDTSELRQELLRKQNELDSAARELERSVAVRSMSKTARELELAEAQGQLRKARLKADTPAGVTKAIDAKKAKLDLELAEGKVASLQEKAVDAERKERAELAVLRDRHQRAESRIVELRSSMDKMTVKAARRGTVIYRTNWRGDKAKVGEPAWRGRDVLEIAGAGGMKAAGVIDEVDLSRVKVGQNTRLRLDAQPDVEYVGKLVKIADSISRKSAENPVKVARVEVELEVNSAEVMRPGMRFRGDVEVDRRENVVLVPAQAVMVTRDGPVVRVLRGDDSVAVEIEAGARNDLLVEVLSGLDEGERVIVRGEGQKQ